VHSYFVVLQISGVSPRIKIHHLDPSMNRSIKSAWQSEWVFLSYRMMFKEVKERNKQLPLQCFWKKKTTKKILKHSFWGKRSIIRRFSLFVGGLGAYPVWEARGWEYMNPQRVNVCCHINLLKYYLSVFVWQQTVCHRSHLHMEGALIISFLLLRLSPLVCRSHRVYLCQKTRAPKIFEVPG
jgi:hypothetical protein